MGTGAETQGVVMCNQPRTIDMAARSGRFVEAVSDELLDEVMARLQPVFE
jgi:mRNA interferase ChpB